MLRIKRFLAALGGVVFIFILSGCGGAKTIQGEYDVTGSGGATVATIVYAPSGMGGNSQAVSATLPWIKTFSATESEGGYQGSYVFLSAQNDSASGMVTVTVKENGSLYQQNYSTTAVTIVGNF